MNVKTRLSTTSALDTLYKGKPGVFGLIKNGEGNLLFYGYGKPLEVSHLWVRINDSYMDKNSFPFQLIMRKQHKSRQSWFVLSTENWGELSNSEEGDNTLQCIAMITPPKNLEKINKPDYVEIPLMLYAKFDAECKSVILAQEMEINKLFISEAKAMHARFQISSQHIDCVDFKKKTNNEEGSDESSNMISYLMGGEIE